MNTHFFSDTRVMFVRTMRHVTRSMQERWDERMAERWPALD